MAALSIGVATMSIV